VDAAGRDVVSVESTAPLVNALELMIEEGLDHLPVVDGDRLVGICTRADVVGARADQLALERRQSGWLRPIVARRRPRRVLLIGNHSLGHPGITETVAALAGRPVPSPVAGGGPAPAGRGTGDPTGRAGPARVYVHVVVPTGP